MKISKLRRIGSGLLAVIIAMSMYVGAAIPAAAGDDGSDAMNEAYAAHESLMPIGPSFNVNTLLKWTPETDPDARYSKASIALTDRTGGFVVNPKANPEAKLMICSLANSDHDNTSAQGTEDFMSWAFNYWQYADSFVYWSGSEEGIICCPTGEFTDAAHTNGVPVVATLGFPWGSGTGYIQQVKNFVQKAADGSFPVADKLIEVMDYYGFDGYFFNQESYDCGPEEGRLMNEMMRYMHRKRPDMLISWYDSMLPGSGGVSYQDSVNDNNKGWMEADPKDGVWGVDEFFMNYNWTDYKVNTTVTTMNSINRSPFDAFAGIDVQQNCMSTPFSDQTLLDANGKMKISLALYCPNSTLGLSPNGEKFHEVERQFYVNAVSDPRVETASPNSSEWLGMSRFFADKTPITSAPFVTNFNSGHGKGYWVDGVLSRDKAWSYQSNQDVMPTWTWIIDSTGSKLAGGYDFDDAYNGGSSIKFEGSLDADAANDIMLYSTDITVTDSTKLSLTYKNDDGKMKLVAYYGDDTTTSYAACTRAYYDLAAGEADTWTTTEVNVGDKAGKKLFAIGMQIESDTAVDAYKVNLGQFKITESELAVPAAPDSAILDEIMYKSAYEAEARVYWDAAAGASSYEVYKVTADGDVLLMETPSTALYLPSVKRTADEADVVLKIVPVNTNGVRGAGKSFTLNWMYGNDDSEEYIPAIFDNVCLNAPVTGVSFANDGEPASKAVDGTSANNSKWCATNRSNGWMSIDIGREVTVKRWRVEHAEFGGEAHNMNTVDFALEYKNEAGTWVQVKRIQYNTQAVTDVLLDTPITAREWKLVVYDDGSSPWGGIRIYEWQMFESDVFPQTEPVMMHFAQAENNIGATDTFTLAKVPNGQTVKLYKKTADGYEMIAEKQCVTEQATGDVIIENLDFGAEAGRIYYTTTAVGAVESIKQSASFEAESAEKSAPAKNVSFVKFSQPDSVSSSNGNYIYTTMTVEDLDPGDVIYVYEENSLEWTKMSQPVAEDKTSVSIDRVKVYRTGASLPMQVKRGGKLISDKYTVNTPAFPDPLGTIKLHAYSELGTPLTGVTYGVYDMAGIRVGSVSDELEVVSGQTYTLKCESVPEGYSANNPDVDVTVRTEGQTYDVKVTIKDSAGIPTVTSVIVTPAVMTVKQGLTQQFAAEVVGTNNPSAQVTWSVEGAASAATAINANGLLTVGEDEAARTLIVRATSIQDSTKSGTAAVTVASKDAETENVAFGSTVIAYNGNNLNGVQGPEKLFDGDITNPDTGKWCVDGVNKWVAFDIGEARDITKLTLTHAGAADEYSPKPGQINTAGYEFYVLDESKISVEELLAMTFEERTTLLADSSYWTQVASKTDNLDDVTEHELVGVAGRIFKINVSRTDTTGWGSCVRLYELELSSPIPAQSVLVSGGADVLGTGTTTIAGEGTEKLFDGDYSTKWCTEKTPTWVVFDIGTPATPDRLVITHAGAGEPAEDVRFNTNDFAFQMLDTSKLSEEAFLAMSGTERAAVMANASYWITLVSHTGNEESVTDDVIEASNAARIYRLTVTDGDDNWWNGPDTVRIFELELYGVEGSVTPPVTDKEALNTLIDEVNALNEDDYTTATWAALAEKLAAAEEVAADADADQTAVDAAAEALQAAVDALALRGDKTELNALIDEVNALEENNYTAETWAALAEKLAAAETVAADADALQADIDAAYDALLEAKEALELLTDVNKTALEALIAYAKAEQSKAEYQYVIPMVKAAFEKALADAEAVYANANATQADVDAAYSDLWTKVTMLSFTGNKENLQDLYDFASELPLDLYTEKTAEPVREAIEAAKAVLDDENALQDEIDAAYDALNAVLGELKMKIDKTMLEKLIKQAQAIDLSKYLDASKTDFGPALENAIAVFEDEDATAQEIKDAYDRLQKAIFDLRLIPDKSLLEALLNSVNALEEDNYTTATWVILTEKLAVAEKVADDNNARQADVDAAYTALLEAKEALVERGDKTVLQETVDGINADIALLPELPLTAEYKEALKNAEAVLADEDATQEDVDAAMDELETASEKQDYVAKLYGALLGIDYSIEAGLDQGITAESWNALMEEYDNAKALLENVDEATIEEIEAQFEAIMTAIEALAPAGDGDALAGLIETAKKENLDKYTDESAEAVRDAIAEAEEILANRGTEEELDAAYAALEKALDEAELKPAAPERPTAPDTGDYAPLALPVVLMLAATVLYLKKRLAR